MPQTLLERQRFLDCCSALICTVISISSIDRTKLATAHYSDNIQRLFLSPCAGLALALWAFTARIDHYKSYRNTVVVVYKVYLACLPIMRDLQGLVTRLQMDPQPDNWLSTFITEPVQILTGKLKRLGLLMIYSMLLLLSSFEGCSTIVLYVYRFTFVYDRSHAFAAAAPLAAHDV